MEASVQGLGFRSLGFRSLGFRSLGFRVYFCEPGLSLGFGLRGAGLRSEVRVCLWFRVQCRSGAAGGLGLGF